MLAVPHGGLSEGIRGLLATLFDSVVLVADERSLLACLEALRPDLLVLDVALVPGRGFALAGSLRAEHRELRILLLVSGDEPRLSGAAEEAGADGCLRTGALGSDLLRAVEAVLAGGRAFWSSAPVESAANGPEGAGRPAPGSPRS